jgi:hypothetical protein
MSAVAIELQELLLTRGREMDSRQGVITTWEDRVAAFEGALGRECMECDFENVLVEAVQQDYHTRMHILLPTPSTPLTSTGCWRNGICSFPYRRWTWRCRRRSWWRNMHGAYIPLTGGICRRSWRSFACAWLGLRTNTPPRLARC